MANLVAIVGRPNVGKSTLFNRLTQSRHAIVSDTAGTTRDRQYGKCAWNGQEFSVVDTGGWVVNSDDIFEDAIRRQVLVATEEADLVLFLVDVETGVPAGDEEVALTLRRAKLPVVLVANKVDNSSEYYTAAEFYKLGLGEPICISAATGGGTGDLLDIILSRLPAEAKETVEDDIPRFAVVGRPNAGKSIIINANLKYIDANRKELRKSYPTFKKFREKFQVPQALVDSIMAQGEKQNIKPKDDAERQTTQDNIRRIIKALVARDLWDMSEYFCIIYEDDEVVKKAVELLQQ